jgi:hypothetical protein
MHSVLFQKFVKVKPSSFAIELSIRPIAQVCITRYLLIILIELSIIKFKRVTRITRAAVAQSVK